MLPFHLEDYANQPLAALGFSGIEWDSAHSSPSIYDLSRPSCSPEFSSGTMRRGHFDTVQQKERRQGEWDCNQLLWSKLLVFWITSRPVLDAPFVTAGRSPIASLTVIARNGAPVAVLWTAAYCMFLDRVIFSSGTAKTCMGSGHSGRVSSGEAAHINTRFRDWETPYAPASRIPNLTWYKQAIWYMFFSEYTTRNYMILFVIISWQSTTW